MWTYAPEYGSLVVDTDDSDPDPAVVVNRPDATAEEWETQRGESTVAQDNPYYPPDARVLVVVFLSDLEEFNSEWESFADSDYSLRELASHGVPYYAFPEPRLESAPADIEAEIISLTPAAEKLFEELQEGGVSCVPEDEETLRCTKFGSEYVVRPGGLVSGEGVMADRLDDIAKSVA